VYVLCDVCRGARYNRETLFVRYKGKSIAELLDTTIEEALPVLENVPQVAQKLQTLLDVGLGYIKLGQSATTLSGGEAQRIKLRRSYRSARRAARFTSSTNPQPAFILLTCINCSTFFSGWYHSATL